MVSSARWLGAGLVFAAGAIHLYLYFDYFHRVATIGPLFLLNAAVAAVIAAAILAWDHIAALVAGLLYAAGTLAAFFASLWECSASTNGCAARGRSGRGPSSCWQRWCCSA
jgi:hypothetical protein